MFQLTFFRDNLIGTPRKSRQKGASRDKKARLDKRCDWVRFDKKARLDKKATLAHMNSPLVSNSQLKTKTNF